MHDEVLLTIKIRHCFIVSALLLNLWLKVYSITGLFKDFEYPVIVNLILHRHYKHPHEVLRSFHMIHRNILQGMLTSFFLDRRVFSIEKVQGKNASTTRSVTIPKGPYEIKYVAIVIL